MWVGILPCGEERRNSLVRKVTPVGQRKLPAAQGVSAMILGQSLPHGKTFFALLRLPADYVLHTTRLLLACLLAGPRLSCACAAGTVRTAPCHRGTLTRFLRRLPALLRDDWLEAVFGNWLAEQPCQGTWLLILDQTYCGHNSARLE